MFRDRLSHLVARLSRGSPKELWTVGHYSEEEQQRILRELNTKTPKKVGLEVADDYLDFEQSGLKTYFTPIASALTKHAVEVVPLCSRSIQDYTSALGLARKVKLEGIESELSDRIKKFERLVKEDRSFARELALVFPNEYFLRLYRSVSEVLEKYPTNEGLSSEFYRAAAEKSEIMLERIKRLQPDIAIFGFEHTKQISPLPGYKVVKFYKPLPLDFMWQ